MASDIQEILKKGSKAKLIQLAVDTRQFAMEDLPFPILTAEEIQGVWDKAKQEGWDKELYRATYKAKDVEAQTLATKGWIYEALYYLQMFCKDIQRVEILLDMLKEEYLGDYNEKTEKFETVKEKTQKEMEGDIFKAKSMVFDQLEDITYFKVLQNWGQKLREEGKVEGKDLTSKQLILAEFRYYKDRLYGAKMGFYLVTTSKFGGYRLYRKEQYEELKDAMVVMHLTVATNVFNSLDHIDYLIETLQENKPELLKELAKDKTIYIPERDKIKEIQGELEKELTPMTKKDKDILCTEEYLLGEVDKETRDKIKEADNMLKEYVTNGK